MKKLLLAGAALTVMIAPALADEVPAGGLVPGGQLAQVPPPMMPPVTDWTGVYIGADVGAAWTSQNGRTTVPGASTAGVANTLVTAPFDGSVNWGRGLTGSSDVGFTGGGHLGYNLDFHNGLVIGVETDLEYLGGTSASTSTFSASQATGITGPVNVTNSARGSVPWVGTLRGRIGTTALNPNLLIYGTGGLAFGRNTTSDLMTVSLPAGGPLVERFPFASSTTQTGWAAGGGLEWMLNPSWTVKAEYLHVELSATGAQTVATNFLGPSALATDVMRYRPSGASVDMARVGISYHFGSPPPPPPAPMAAPMAPPAAPTVFIVFFDWDRDTITPEGMQIVQQAADAYKSGAPVQIQVTGYTDRSGSAGYNQRLSERRANNVAKALAARGVPREQMLVSGKGENDNRVPTANGVREPQNRRVEIVK
jgi:opacity protein-like surface antigen